MKKLLIVSWMLFAQLSFASTGRKEIDFTKAQQNVRVFAVGAAITLSGMCILCNAVSELKKDPQNIAQGTLHTVGAMSAMVGASVIGYSVAMAQQQQETQNVSRDTKKMIMILGIVVKDKN